MDEMTEKYGQDLTDASTDSPFGVWILARIDEAARTGQPWMMDPLAVRRAWEGRV